MKLDIVKTGINGEGIAYLNGKPVFLPGAFPDETVDVILKEEQERYARGKVRSILVPSRERVESSCLEKDCDGCPFYFLSYPAQLKYKRQLLCEAVWKYGHVRESFVRDIRPSPEVTGYRSSLKLPVQDTETGIRSGMYRTGSNHFIPIDTCIAHDPRLEAIRRTVMAILREEHFPAFDGKHGLRTLIMRRISEQISIALITGNDTLSGSLIEKLSALPEVVSIVQSVNTEKHSPYPFGSRCRVLYGSAFLEAQFCGLSIRLSPESFFQVNLRQAEALYRMAVSKIDPCDVLYEAYCGIGVMSLLARDKAKKIYGAEAIEQAVQNAACNASANGVENCEFLVGDAAEVLRQLSAQTKVDTLLADPPRTGMDDAMIEAILSSSIRKIVYVSCSPATLGKNIGALKKDFTLQTILPFDMFPGTPHVESISVLTRNGTSDRQKKNRHRKRR